MFFPLPPTILQQFQQQQFFSLLPFLLVLLFSSSSFFLFLYFLAVQRNDYWRRRGIPGPRPVPFLGNIDNMFGKNIAVLQLQKWSRQYGRVFGVQNGWKHVLVVSEPEMVREMLVEKFEQMHGRLISPIVGDTDTSNQVDMFSAKGKRWKRLRSVANPAFSIANLKRVMPLIEDSIKVNVQLMRKATLSGKPIDIHSYFTELTFDVIARVAMGQRESRQFRSKLVQLSKDTFSKFGNNRFEYVSMLFPWLGRNFVGPFVRATGKLRDDPHEILIGKIYEAVKLRKKQKEEEQGKEKEKEDDPSDGVKNKKKWVDFIDLFLESESNAVEMERQTGAYNKAEKFERQNTLDEIVSNCFLLLLAGFDTTANSLSLLSHNLATHPEVQARLWQEIVEVCGEGDGEENEGEGEEGNELLFTSPSYEQLARLKYADAVFKETQRLCPVGSAVVNRICEETTSIGSYTLEKGTAVCADLFTLHRDPAIWGEDAEEFRPERWLEPATITAANTAFFPFGGGQRICIGMRLAMMEVKMELVCLLRAFELRRCAETESEPKLSGQIVLGPEKITIELVPRRTSSSSFTS